MKKERLNKNKSANIGYINIDKLADVLNNDFILSRSKKTNKYRLSIFTSALVASLSLFPGLSFNSDSRDKALVEIIEVPDVIMPDIDSIVSSNEVQEDEVIVEEEILPTKEEVLNDFSLCDTLDKVYKRQEELENLGLIDSDKIYENCALSASLQHFIYEQSIENEIPFDFLLSIIYVETRGNFNSSGQVGVNDEGNWDLGLTQQNSISSLSNFQEKYGVDGFNEAYELLRYNDYVNVCAAFLVCEEINKQFDSFDPYEYAGCYNGWLNWREYETSLEYVKIFQEAYDTVFVEHHTVEKEKNVSNQQLVKVK